MFRKNKTCNLNIRCKNIIESAAFLFICLARKFFHKRNRYKNMSLLDSLTGLYNLNNEHLSKEQELLLYNLAEKDMYSYVHSKYVVKYSVELAIELDLPKEMINNIRIAAWLHDIGKLLIPNEILRKRGKLTDEEYDIIKCHIKNGLNILLDFNLPETVINAIKYHHERFDGEGYPYGIKGDNIPIESKIIQIADAFSAMTIKRVYREIIPIEDALMEIVRNKGTQFDPEIADIFIRLFKSKGI